MKQSWPAIFPGMRSLLTFAFALLLATAASAQQSSHVFILMLENRSDSEAMQYMPYLSGLASQYGEGLHTRHPTGRSMHISRWLPVRPSQRGVG